MENPAKLSINGIAVEDLISAVVHTTDNMRILAPVEWSWSNSEKYFGKC